MVQNRISIYNETNAPGCRVFCDAHAASGTVLDLCAQMAVTGRVRLLDFGNRCDMYYVARRLRYLTRDPVSAMENICLRRAFTCYQALSLAASLGRGGTEPVFVLDLCAPFLDENVPAREAERVLRRTAAELESVSKTLPVFVGIKPISNSASSRQHLPDILLPLLRPAEKGENLWAEPFRL